MKMYIIILALTGYVLYTAANNLQKVQVSKQIAMEMAIDNASN
jgi:hypothetical protein